MFLNLLLLSVVNCKYEVGLRYDYFFDAKTTMTTEKVDSPPLTSSFNFSCISSIICTSVNKHGFEFRLKLSGIRLIQKDTKGDIINDDSGLNINMAFSKLFTFTILNTGGVGEVKHSEDELEDIVKVKTGIISQFITLDENKADNDATETLDNQGMYISHWKREKKRERERDDVVDLTRQYTDEDFIHFRDKNVTKDSFLLNVFERKKMTSGVITESTSEHNIYISGKQFHKRGRRRGDDIRSNGDSSEIYNGTEISTSSSSSLQFLKTVKTPLYTRGTRSFRNVGVSAESESSRMKTVPYFNRDFYADREQAQKQTQSHSKNTSPSFASLVKKKKNLDIDTEWCGDDDSKNNTNTNKTKSSFFPSPSPSELTRDDIFRISATADNTNDKNTHFRDWEKERLQRIYRYSLGDDFSTVIDSPPPKRLCRGMDPLLEPPYEDGEYDLDIRPPYLSRSRSEFKLQKLLSRVSPANSSSPSSSSLLSQSPFNPFASDSNGIPIIDIECPKNSGLTTCYQIGGGRGGGNDDFGVWTQAVIYSGSVKQFGKSCLEGCNFLLDIDTGISVKILGKNLTIIRLEVYTARIDNYPRAAFVKFVLFNMDLGCKFQDTACGGITINICEFKKPIPNLGMSFKQSFLIFEIEFTVGLVAYFRLEFVFEICPPEGSVAASLPPTVGLSFGVEAEVSILKSKAGLALTASTELSLIPQVALNLSQNAIVFRLVLEWNPITVKMEVTFKICFFGCWGGSWTIFELKAPAIRVTLYEHFWKLPWTSNDVYETSPPEVATGTGTGTETGMENKEDADMRKAVDVLLRDDAGANTDAARPAPVKGV